MCAKAFAVVSLLFVALGLASAQDAGQADNVLTAWLDQANIHPPLRVGRLTIFPISLSQTNRLANVLTMEEALGKKLLEVQELDDPQVPQAVFINRSKSQMIFLMAGEVIIGGRQNRTLISDALLGPDSRTTLSVYCVQRGRWEGRKGFAESAVAPLSVQEKSMARSGQSEVWSEVRRANERARSADASEDLASGLAKPENAKRLSAMRKLVEPKLPEKCAGIVVARDGRIIGADLFNSSELFDSMRPRVLNVYFGEHLDEDVLPVKGAREAPTQEQVRTYLQACYRASFSEGDRSGVGRLYSIRGAANGQLLAYSPARIVPMREREDRVAPLAAECMVHACLRPGLIPVKPEPVPMPRRERDR